MKLSLEIYADCYNDAMDKFNKSIQNLKMSLVCYPDIEIYGDKQICGGTYIGFKFNFTAEVTPVH